MNRIVILGAAESGVGAALLAQAKGHEVFVSDNGIIAPRYKETLKEANISYEEGGHTESLILTANEVVKSPGIPDKVQIIKKLKEKNIPIIDELEFAARYTKAKFIAITGSNGKTTTTLLTYHLLKTAGFNVGLAGNIGDSLAKQVIADTFDYYVLEVSSFQLDGLYQFRADIGILTNITPDHLDRYEYKFENYIQSKFRILQNMNSENYFITYLQDKTIQEELKNTKTTAKILAISLEEKVALGAYTDANGLNFCLPNGSQLAVPYQKLTINGKHNYLNAMAAVLAAVLWGADSQAIEQGLQTFQNAPHRLEEIATIGGVRFVNDSKATNVDSVKFALDSFREPVVLIAGGVDKGNDYSLIENLVLEKVKAIVCMGIDNEPLHKAFDGKITTIIDTNNMEDAVQKAQKIAKKGDVVLLSPACASFDLFQNYQDRGNQFKEQVKLLT